MIHIAEKKFYQSVTESIQEPDAVILAEGVSDESNLLKGGFSYKGVGSLLGLSSQKDMKIGASLVHRGSFGEKKGNKPLAGPHLVRADVDASLFAPETRAFLMALTSAFFSEKPLTQGHADYQKWTASQSELEKTMDQVKRDLIDLRNETLLAVFKEAMPRYTTLIVPWGAMHMPGIEEELLKMGFIETGKKERLSIPFDGIIGRLKKLTEAQNSL